MDSRGVVVPQPLIAEQHLGHVGGIGTSLNVANAIPSSMAWLAPWPICGSIACAASPSSPNRPFVQRGNGSRSYRPTGMSNRSARPVEKANYRRVPPDHQALTMIHASIHLPAEIRHS